MNQTSGYRYSAIIIEKDDIVATEIISHLKEYRFRTVQIESVDEAVKLLKNQDRTGAYSTYFIILNITAATDEALQSILRFNIPVIAVTEQENFQKAVNSLNQGAASYILTPLTDPVLIDSAIENCLRISRGNRQSRLYTLHLEEELKRKTEENERKNYLLQNFNKNLERMTSASNREEGPKNLTDLGPDILNDFGAHLQASGGSIYIRENSGLRLAHTIETKHVPDFLPFPLNEKSPFRMVLETGKSMLVNNIESEKELSTSGWSGYKDSSFMIFPIPGHHGNIEGILSLHNKVKPPFIGEDKEMGQLMSSFYAEVNKTVTSIEALHLSETRYKNLAENSAAVIFSFSIEADAFDYVNDAFVDLTGYGRQHLIGSGFIDMVKLLQIPEKEDFISQFESLVTGRSSGNGIEYRIVTATGRTKWLFQQSVVITNSEGFTVSIDGILTEITEQKEAEEKLKTLVNQKDLLLSEINHRVKNNLQVISSFINLQSGLENEESNRKSLQKIKNRITSMALVHDNIYDTNLMPSIDVKNYIISLIQHYRDQKIADENIEIELDIESITLDLDRAVLCGLLMNEALSNIFNHAFDEGERGKVAISFKNREYKYEIRIFDSGRGFHPDDITLSTAEGLGLDIMKNLITQLDGSISFVNNQGTIILIKFPVQNTKIREELL
ncbi:MAG: histidine kinase dimerization/phosphoacceptor domain -containing protein [Spirochaetales bacterium]|uniref:Histidine kinase dimerization/phosphoacceptor domain -containing protein n=1 Tax=Candidatus Thalassospirochaeta sargassi TaxID=3119039 RepID=A0AAJ1IHL9_9SPIO|nr:histidine kinase dimerization/phosphoacceptor domain -containing protein [Spirochaetales bacterium]